MTWRREAGQDLMESVLTTLPPSRNSHPATPANRWRVRPRAGRMTEISRPVLMDTEEDMSEFVMPIDKEKDSSESALCGRKLPLWLGLLLLLAAVGLLVPMIYFAVIANSKACVDGLQAQKECQEVNQHVQRQLTQAQELLNEKKAEAATCKQAVVTLRDSLKTEQARVEELQGELASLNQQLQDALTKERRKSEASAEDNGSVWFFMLHMCTLIICKCLKI
uniref:Bone marrow stromal cell antigen 2 n=1 Tax=Bos indicus x Bos taurus TaxID=30522 RepID=A0A4W2FXB7_BOBOX